VVGGEFLLVRDESHELAEFGRGFLHNGDVLFGLLIFGLAVDSTNTWLSYPLAVDVGGLYLICEGLPVGELEVPD
jgi:hypothetical protein